MMALGLTILVLLLAGGTAAWLVLEDMVNHVVITRISRLAYELGRTIMFSAGFSTDGPWDALPYSKQQQYTSMAYSVFRQQPIPVPYDKMTIEQQAVYVIMQAFFAEADRVRGLKRT